MTLRSVRTDDLHADAYATERMSPSLVSSTASLDADLLNTKAADKENMRQSKYSIVREKYLQKYMRYMLSFHYGNRRFIVRFNLIHIS